MKNLYVALALAVLSAVAFAMPSPADVASAVNREDWSKAESLLQEVLRDRESPKAHYQLGQVYGHQFRHAEALAEYRKAKELDPSMKFASSPKLFEAMVSREEALLDGNLGAGTSTSPSQVTNVSPPSPVIGGEPSTAQQHATDTDSNEPQPETAAEDGEWHKLWLVVPGALSLAILFLLWMFNVRAREQRGAVAPVPDDLAALPKRLDSAEAVCKAAPYPTGRKDLVLESISKLREDVARTVSHWQQGAPKDRVIPELVARASRLETAAETGVVTTPPVAVPGDHRRVGPTVVTSRPVMHSIAPPAAVSVTEPHRDSSDGGFLTGVVVGSMLSSSASAKSEVRRDESSALSGWGGSDGGGGGGPTFDGGNGSDW